MNASNAPSQCGNVTAFKLASIYQPGTCYSCIMCIGIVKLPLCSQINYLSLSPKDTSMIRTELLTEGVSLIVGVGGVTTLLVLFIIA